MKTVRKKTFLRTLFIAFIFVGLIGCEGCQDQPKQEDDQPDVEVKEPAQIISVAKAKMLYDNYTVHRKDIIRAYEESGARLKKDQANPAQERQQQMQRAAQEQEKDSFDVARYGYYKYEDLKNYLAYIEQEAARAGEKVSTVRVYFSNYPDESKYVHPKQNSFIFVPTVNKGGQEYAFSIILNEGEEKWRPSLFNDELERLDGQTTRKILGAAGKEEASLVPNLFSTGTTSFSPPFQQEKSLKMNEGSMVPPPHNK